MTTVAACEVKAWMFQDGARLAALLRPFIRRINAHPGMTDALRGTLGLPIPDREPTRNGVGPAVPGLALELRPGQVFVHRRRRHR